MRSQLFVPGDSEKKMNKGLESGADCLFIDLEDSVAAASKETARKMACDFLNAARKLERRPLLYIRVNALDTGLTDRDLDAVMPGRPDGILLPKSQGGVDVQHLSAKLAVREAENDITDGITRICCVATETASAVFGLSSYRRASRRVSALTWGAEDLSADLGAETNRLEDGTHAPVYVLARNMTLLAAVSAGVQPIDTVYPNFRDEAGFRRECIEARRDGFTGKMAIHPAQVPIINEIFTPPAAEILRAKKIVQAFADNPTAGVIGMDGEMLDKPHLERAKKLLARVAAAPGGAA
jgi:citrate lyase subunit beta/citryl-CoA lyase